MGQPSKGDGDDGWQKLSSLTSKKGARQFWIHVLILNGKPVIDSQWWRLKHGVPMPMNQALQSSGELMWLKRPQF